jgi:SPX domain protein involved in polyphosphate accumulation
VSTLPDQPTHLRFRRYECKYLITEAQAARVVEYAKPYVEQDPFAARSHDGRYQISSLYLDSDDLRLYHETLGGIKDRFKLRIRAYTDRFEDPVFFEVKKRNDRVILKERSRIRRAEIGPAIEGWSGSRERMDPAELASLEAFQSRCRRLGAKPRVLIRYSREAYIGSFDDGVRVTFDRFLRAKRQSQPGLFFGADGWRTVEAGKVVLELKFNNSCPAWISTIVRQASLRRISFSKYALSVTTLNDSHTLQN